MREKRNNFRSMSQRFEQSVRRILTFPAVHPCEGISPTTLLQSLITLSHTICSYHSKSFVTQRRNAREIIRQIGILLTFLEDIKDRGGLVPSDSMVLCFSELHLAFQKILFLLEDCTRQGARLWILMKSHFVASQFQLLVRSVATTLDVLPLRSIRTSREIKELVGLVGKQARRAKLDLDVDDEDATNKVILILNQFENGFEPESTIKRVLDYLGITNWSECQKEIKFLEEEIGLECQSNNSSDRDFPLLSSLVGFMCYCRGVILENSNFGTPNQSEGGYNVDAISCWNLEDFRCPISLELMTDPVTISTGQTYDRANIQKWFNTGNLVCPKTGERLTTTDMVPNTALRNLIQQLCADNGVSISKSRKKNRDISRTIVPGSPSAAEAIKYLSEFLTGRLYFGTEDKKNQAAYEIRLLAKSNIFNRSCLIQAGTIAPLMSLLASTNPTLQENATAALLKLSKHSYGKKWIIDNGGLKPVVSVLKEGLKLESRQIAAAIIFYLSSAQKYRKLIGETPELIPSLVELIKDGTNLGKKNSVVAIFGLLLCPSNHYKVLSAGIVPLLVDIIATTSEKADLVSDSLAVLATLAENTDGSIKIVSALPLIIDSLHASMSRAGKEYCVSILLSLCNNCGVDAVAVLAKDTSLMASLYSLITEGTSHSSKKACSLINYIHKFQQTKVFWFDPE